AKRVRRALLAELPDVRRHGQKHFLKDIRNVLLRQITAAAPVQDERRVQADEPIPCRSVAGADAVQQAARGRRRGRRSPSALTDIAHDAALGAEGNESSAREYNNYSGGHKQRRCLPLNVTPDRYTGAGNRRASMQALTCPTPSQLTDFTLGQLPHSLLASIAEHVEHCTGCAAALQQLDEVTDPLLAR